MRIRRTPAQQTARTELRDAKRALAADPVNTGAAGVVDINSPAARTNLAAQDRVRAAEQLVKRASR